MVFEDLCVSNKLRFVLLTSMYADRWLICQPSHTWLSIDSTQKRVIHKHHVDYLHWFKLSVPRTLTVRVVPYSVGLTLDCSAYLRKETASNLIEQDQWTQPERVGHKYRGHKQKDVHMRNSRAYCDDLNFVRQCARPVKNNGIWRFLI
jgi:hypothetical protein